MKWCLLWFLGLLFLLLCHLSVALHPVLRSVCLFLVLILAILIMNVSVRVSVPPFVKSGLLGAVLRSPFLLFEFPLLFHPLACICHLLLHYLSSKGLYLLAGCYSFRLSDICAIKPLQARQGGHYKLPVACVVSAWVSCKEELLQVHISTQTLHAQEVPNKVHGEVQLL